MKSIKEKAKAYDIALDKIKMLLGTGNSCSREELEYVFPELKEGGDERIRKALIKLVKKTGEGYENVIDGVSIENAISWLENQVEQKPAEWSEEDELSCFESALFTAFSDAWQEYLNGEEVNVKQWAKEHSKEILEAAKEELKEQKSAWSEEDETKIKSIIALLKSPALCAMDGNKGIIDENIKYLKSLRPQNRWKPSDCGGCLPSVRSMVIKED